jgi:hypothetical protein
MINERRKLKRRAFALFNSLWQTGEELEPNAARRKAYRWLAKELGIRSHKIKLADMTIEELKEVVRLCESAPRTESGTLLIN